MSITQHNPEPTEASSNRRTVAIVIAILAVAVAAVAAAALLGFGWFTVTSVDGDPDPATPAPAAPVAIPDGETFAFIREIGDGVITADPALMLDGQEARDAAEADGVIQPGEDLPNDFYISNPDPEGFSIGVSPDAEVTVLTFSSSGEIIETTIELADLAVAFTGDYPGVAIYGLVAGEFPVTLTIESGTVVDITQVYLP